MIEVLRPLAGPLCRLVLVVVLGNAATSVAARAATFDCDPDLCNQCFNGRCCDASTHSCIVGPAICLGPCAIN